MGDYKKCEVMMIRLDSISIGYRDNILIENVSLEFEQGKLCALLGRNGSGKSTLLRTLIGQQNLLAGNIYIGDKNLKDIKNTDLAKTISFVTTERVRIQNFRSRDLVALGRYPYTNWIGRLSERDERIVQESLDMVGMLAYADKTLDSMSDGECQRIMIARALAQDTPVVLLDEPTSFLDLPNRYDLCILLKKMAYESNKCVIFSTHELDIALNVCDTIALIGNKDLYHENVNDMVKSGRIEKLFQNDMVRFDSNTQKVLLKNI